MKVAVAASDSKIAGGHFAHAPKFLIFEISESGWRLLEERSNPLAAVPDVDAGELAEEEIVHAHGMHGPMKYAYLRENVLPDADIVVAGGACATSVAYFLSEGAKIVFAEPGTSTREVVEAIAKLGGNLPELGYYENGEIKNLEEE